MCLGTFIRPTPHSNFYIADRFKMAKSTAPVSNGSCTFEGFDFEKQTLPHRACQHFFSEGGNGRKKNAHNFVGTGLRSLVLPSLRPSEIWHSAGIGRILQPWLFELWIYLNSKVYDLHRYFECASWAKYAAFEFHSFSTWCKRRQMHFSPTRILISGCRCITRLNFFLSCG